MDSFALGSILQVSGQLFLSADLSLRDGRIHASGCMNAFQHFTKFNGSSGSNLEISILFGANM